MPQKINKKQICEKILGPSHYSLLYIQLNPCKNEVNRTRCKEKSGHTAVLMYILYAKLSILLYF